MVGIRTPTLVIRRFRGRIVIEVYFISSTVIKLLNVTPDNVLLEELPDNDCDVGRVDLVDQTVNGFLQSLPG